MSYKRINELHETSWKGLKILIKERITNYGKPFRIGLTLSTIQFVYLICKDNKYIYSILIKVLDINLSYFPNLLGFLLGGLAIVVGFSNVELIKKTSALNKPSIYQILNSNFTFVIIVLLFITSFSFFLKWFISFDIEPVIESNILLKITNSLICSILLFASIFIVVLIFNIVLNLFTLSQVNNLYFTLKKKSEDENEINDVDRN